MTIMRAPSTLLLLLLLLPTARADTIDVCVGTSLEGLGGFTGSLDYQVDQSGTATLSLSITNTSDPSNGGYITALALYDEGLSVQGFSSSSSNFALMSGGVQVSPFPDADFGASATGGQWLGGGKPSGGIAVGETVTFTWTLSGAGAGSLSASSFGDILVRFRGFENGGSDKVVGKPCQPVPEPASIGLAALAAGAVLARRRRGEQPTRQPGSST